MRLDEFVSGCSYKECTVAEHAMLQLVSDEINRRIGVDITCIEIAIWGLDRGLELLLKEGPEWTPFYDAADKAYAQIIAEVDDTDDGPIDSTQ